MQSETVPPVDCVTAIQLPGTEDEQPFLYLTSGDHKAEDERVLSEGPRTQ
jgi:hypothetical protein